MRSYDEWARYFQECSHKNFAKIDDHHIEWGGLVWKVLRETDYHNSIVYVHGNNLILKITPVTDEAILEISYQKKLNRVCSVLQHFPVSVFHEIWEKNNIIFHVQEKRGIDLRTFMMEENRRWDEDHWFGLFTQLFFAIYFMNTVAHLSHRDLHWTNVLIMESDKTDLTYHMEDNDYVLHDQMYIFSVCDLASCRDSKEDGFEEYAAFVSSIFRWIRRFHFMERPHHVGLFISDIRSDIYEGRHCMKSVFDRYIHRWVTKKSSGCTDVHEENS